MFTVCKCNNIFVLESEISKYSKCSGELESSG